jgi:hypothetical protein
MNDGIAPGNRAIQGVAVAHVGELEFDIGRRGPRIRTAMHIGAQRIHDPHVVAAREQRLEHMLSDESRAAG